MTVTSRPLSIIQTIRRICPLTQTFYLLNIFKVFFFSLRFVHTLFVYAFFSPLRKIKIRSWSPSFYLHLAIFFDHDYDDDDNKHTYKWQCDQYTHEIRCKLNINLLFGVVEHDMSSMRWCYCHLELIVVYYIILVFKKNCALFDSFFHSFVCSLAVSFVAVTLKLFVFGSLLLNGSRSSTGPDSSHCVSFVCLCASTLNWCSNTRYLTLMQWINVIYFTWKLEHELTARTQRPTTSRDKRKTSTKHESLSIICYVVCYCVNLCNSHSIE